MDSLTNGEDTDVDSLASIPRPLIGGLRLDDLTPHRTDRADQPLHNPEALEATKARPGYGALVVGRPTGHLA
jgi:hypothetical protein